MMHEDRLKDFFAINGENALTIDGVDNEEVAELLGATPVTPLQNEYNLLLLGPMYFGQPLQTPSISKFVYDTGKNELSTTSTHCLFCEEKTKYYNSSASAGYEKKSSKINALIYGLTVLNGQYFTDTVCLDTSGTYCVENFLAYEIRESVLMTEGIDGYFGLSPSYRNATLSLPDQLYQAGVISENKFTIWINNDASNSESASMTFGGIPEGSTNGESYSLSINTAKSQWWTVSYKGLLYGSDSIYGSNIKYAIIDSGTTFINLGNQDFINFK